ncbi:hypothetical protein CIPAW_05G234800 [Carya illinoinensis]|uniref:Uncharacterized protein n=1 Tax=Carya illinoinensis TaxID=32201 RepID=A0A8T1QMR1_CARIL|nr:hypothetical protein CIPAW_05G234800 [Carya illinoinensis]
MYGFITQAAVLLLTACLPNGAIRDCRFCSLPTEGFMLQHAKTLEVQMPAFQREVLMLT